MLDCIKNQENHMKELQKNEIHRVKIIDKNSLFTEQEVFICK